jgi:hypothetical protein
MTALGVESLLDAVLIPERTVRHVNFFNGRLLTAEDLKAQQVADRLGRQQLGRAIGTGVVTGFRATLVSDGTDGRSPVVEVTGGLAIAPCGQPIELTTPQVNVTLARRKPLLPIDVGLFDACDELPPGGDISGRGAYVLVVTVASAFREQAPKVAVGDRGIAKGCGDRYVVEGVAFRLVEVPPSALEVLSDADRTDLSAAQMAAEQPAPTPAEARSRVSLARNLLAHAFLDGGHEERELAEPWRLAQPDAAATGIVDAMRECAALRDGDVPIALVCWTARGVRFLDPWAVRRRPAPLVDGGAWPQLDARRIPYAEARFRQFEEHARSLVVSPRDTPFVGQVSLATHFRFLPPVVVLPLASGGVAGSGFDVDGITGGMTFRERVFIDGTRLLPLLRDSFDHSVIDVTSGEMVWTYLIVENQMAIDAGATPAPRPVLVVSSGHLAYQGDPQFDLARWSYANYGPGVLPENLGGG